MKKTAFYLSIISLLLVFAITCQRKSKAQNDKLGDEPKWSQWSASVIDPGFLNTYGQIEYLAIAYANIGGRPAASNNISFRNQLAALQYDITGNGENREEAPLLEQYSNNSLKSTLTGWAGTPQPDLGDAIIHWQGIPQGNGNPPQPFNDGFITQFLWKDKQNSDAKSFYTYTNILGADETYVGYQSHQNTYNALPFLVIPIKDFKPSLDPAHPNQYLPIKGYRWNNATNTLNIVTFNTWEDVEAAAMNTYYIVTVSIDRDNYPPAKFSFECGDIICGDGFCNMDCNENCPNDCGTTYKLELTSVTLTEDARVKLTNPLPNLYKHILFREEFWGGKYEIHYAMALVHTDGSVNYIEEGIYNKWTRGHVSRRRVDENNITSSGWHNGGSDHTHNNEQLLSNNFVPFGPNGDRIYLIFWEDDWRGEPTCKLPVQLHRLPNNALVKTYEFAFHSVIGEYPYGSKPTNVFVQGTTFGYYSATDKFPLESRNSSDHVKIIDFSDFTVNGTQTEGTYIFNDAYEKGNSGNNPMRGGEIWSFVFITVEEKLILNYNYALA